VWSAGEPQFKLDVLILQSCTDAKLPAKVRTSPETTAAIKRGLVDPSEQVICFRGTPFPPRGRLVPGGYEPATQELRRDGSQARVVRRIAGRPPCCTRDGKQAHEYESTKAEEKAAQFASPESILTSIAAMRPVVRITPSYAARAAPF